MSPRLSVWWPRVSPSSAPDPFTVSFCLKESQRAAETSSLAVQWLFYDAAAMPASLLAVTEGPWVLGVSDPTVLLNPHSLQRLFRTAQTDSRSIGPVFPRSEPAQTAALPFPYWDLATYWETAQHLASRTEDACTKVSTLDARCFVTPRGTLAAAVQAGSFQKVMDALLHVADGGGLVDHGAFFHVFGGTHDHAREDLVALVPPEAQKILDIGCATGFYGKTLRQVRSSLHLVGVESDPHQARVASRFYDRIYVEPFEQAHLEEAPFDVVNGGDVLEHMVDPWKSLEKMRRLLRPEGYLVLSVPNVGHWTVVRALMQGSFAYIPAGLLCRGHLRWFTEESLREALEEAGFVIEVFQASRPKPTPQGRVFLEELRKLSGVHVHEPSLMTEGFLVRARIPG